MFEHKMSARFFCYLMAFGCVALGSCSEQQTPDGPSVPPRDNEPADPEGDDGTSTSKDATQGQRDSKAEVYPETDVVVDTTGDSTVDSGDASQRDGHSDVDGQSADVSISVSPRSGEVPLEVSFSAELSSNNSTYSTLWRFGDGESTSDTLTPTHVYDEPGTYTPSLKLIDAQSGNTVLTKRAAEIRVNESETSGLDIQFIDASPDKGAPPLEVFFQLTYTYDGDDADVDVNWSFGDGSTSSETNPSHRYEDPGLYKAEVKVTAPDAEAKDSIEIDARQPLSVSASQNKQKTDSSFSAPRTIGFKCSKFYGTGPSTYHWTFGDGSEKTVNGRTGEVTHTYESANNSPYDAECKVTAQNGQTGSATVTVHVGDAPIKSVDVERTSQAAPVAPRDVDLRCEIDGGNPPFTYTWLFDDGKQTQTTSSSRQATTTHTYDDLNQSPFSPECEVTDKQGDTGSGQLANPIDIYEDRTPEIIGLDVNPQVGQSAKVNQASTFVADVIGGNTRGGSLTYDWSFGDGGQQTTTSNSVSHIYRSTGRYDVSVTVTDIDGDSVSDSVEVHVKQ